MSNPDSEPVHLLINPATRRGAADGAKAADHLRRLGRQVVEITAGAAADVVEAIQGVEDVRRLIIVGGDGLIHHVLPALVETETVLGLVPSGTGNDFARALGISGRLTTAVERALADPIDVDLMSVTFGDGVTRWAASVLTAGFSGRVNATANHLSFPRGQQKYTAATLLEVRELHPFHLQLVVDGQPHRTQSTFFAIGNTRYFGGGMAICPSADPTDGRLDITMVDAVSRRRLLAFLPTVFTGHHVRNRSVRQLDGRSITVDTTEDLWADGEPLGPGPAEVECVAGALRVAGAL